jgi:hypothetical protein
MLLLLGILGLATTSSSAAAPMNQQIGSIDELHYRTGAIGQGVKHSSSQSHSPIDRPHAESASNVGFHILPISSLATSSHSMNPDSPKEHDLLSVLEQRQAGRPGMSYYQRKMLKLGKVVKKGRGGASPAKLDPSDPKYGKKLRKQETDRARRLREKQKKEGMDMVAQGNRSDGRIPTHSSDSLSPLEASTSKPSVKEKRKWRRKPPHSALAPQ